MTEIVLVNMTSRQPDDLFSRLVPALQVQVSQDFAPFWRQDAKIWFASRGSLIPAGAWQIQLRDTSDQPGALGYHQDDTGIPISEIFVEDDLRYGSDVGVTISHELLEMLADPVTTREITVGDRTYVVEVCDPVEADSDGYQRDGVRLSNFVLPGYYGLPAGCAAGARWDFCARLAGPCPSTLASGYLLYYSAGAWHTDAGRGPDGSMSKRASKPFGRQWARAQIARPGAQSPDSPAESLPGQGLLL